MPVKRRTTRRRTTDSDRLEIEWFTGRTKRRFFANENPFGDPPDPEREREAWARHGGEVVAAFVVDEPGERPASWWRHEPHEPKLHDESTADFLDRLGAWLDGERARWEANNKHNAEHGGKESGP